MTTPTRRIRRGRPTEGPSGEDLRNVAHLLAAAGAAQRLMEEAITEHKTSMAALYSAMKSISLVNYSVPGYTATVYRPAGRATNLVDAEQFRNLLGDDKEFYAAISVSVTAARKLVAHKALDAITTTIPAKPGAETVSVVFAQ